MAPRTGGRTLVTTGGGLAGQPGAHVTGHGVADDLLARCSPVTVAR